MKIKVVVSFDQVEYFEGEKLQVDNRDRGLLVVKSMKSATSSGKVIEPEYDVTDKILAVFYSWSYWKVIE